MSDFEEVQVPADLLEEAREASFGEMAQHELRVALRKALREKVRAEKGLCETDYVSGCYIEEVFQSFIVAYEYCDCEDDYRPKYFKRPYTVSGSAVTVGDKGIEIELSWVPKLVSAMEAALTPEQSAEVRQARETEIKAVELGETSREASEIELPVSVMRCTEAAFREAEFQTGLISGIIPISPGTSINRAHYATEVVKRDVNVFNGLPVFYDHQDPNQPKPLKNAIGVLENARWDDANGVPLCDLRYPPSQESVITDIKEKYALYGSDKVGFSIDMPVKARVGQVDGKAVRVVEALIGGGSSSVDIVWRPSAGGGFGNALEAAQGIQELEMLEGMTVDEILAARPDLKDALKVTEAVQPKAETPAPAANQAPVMTVEAIQEAIREGVEQATRKADFERKIAGLKIPERAKLAAAREAAESKYETSVCESILSDWANMSAAQSGGPAVSVPGGSVVVTEAADKRMARLMGAALNQDQIVDGERVRRFTRLSEAILAWHPDMYPMAHQNRDRFVRECVAKLHWGGGLLEEVFENHSRESIVSTTFNLAWADVMNKVLEKVLAEPSWNTWRQIVSDSKSLSDFDNTLKIVRVGEYANIPKVLEGAPYQPATTPGQEKVELGIDKYGETEDFTWEAALRDDLGVLARIPAALGRAWTRTVHDAVWGALQSNSGAGDAMDYDSKALYHTDHANILASAFSKANLVTIDGKMRDQTDISNGKKKAYRPKFLCYADAAALRESVWEALSSMGKITASAAEINLPNYIRALGYEPIEVIYPESTTTRYELIADPVEFPTIAVGFLNGREAPELFIQDMERVGSVFNADKITYKIRGTFGYKPLNHRAFQRGNV